MRARSGLAQALWAAGERDDAIGHYRDMMRLNPNDNQGVRYLLAACLLETERHADLDALLEAYEEDGSAAWCYTQALSCFRRDGDSAQSRSLLGAALAANGHVPDYLLGERTLPPFRPDFITMGGEDEAIEYTRDFEAGWRRTAGALAWLRDARRASPTPARRARR